MNLEDVLGGEIAGVDLPAGEYTLPTTSGDVSISGSKVDQTVTVEGCTFNASQSAHTWNGIHVAAVSMDGSQGGTYNVVLNNNTVDNNFNGLWQDKTGAGNITVTVDGNTELTAN